MHQILWKAADNNIPNWKVSGDFFDEKASQWQPEALQMIFSGKADGFMAEFAKLIGELRGLEFTPIKFEIADDLSYWRKSISKG